MAEDKKEKASLEERKVTVVKEELPGAAKQEAAKQETAKPELTDAERDAQILAARQAPQNTGLPLTFDRWFSTKGRPDHHKHGMRAFANTAGKKTIAQWDAIFEKY